jgi:small-conductance mechanosensitive channel
MSFSSFSDQLWLIALKAWDRLPSIVLTFLVGYLVIKIVKTALHSLIRVTRANQAMKGIIISVIDFGLWIMLLAAVLQQVGLTQLSLALSGSVLVLGLAISTGSAAFIQDLVAGIFLAQDRDFNVGYRVQIDAVEGTVEKMDARKIRIRDDRGHLHIFPNSIFDRAAWIVKNEDRDTK